MKRANQLMSRKDQNNVDKEEEEEARKGNPQARVMNSATLKGKLEEEKAMSVWDCGSPLYDSYELVTLNHLIDRHLMAPFPSKTVITRFITNHSHVMLPSVADQKSQESFSLSKFFGKMMRKRKDHNEERRKKKMRRGLAGFIGNLLYCGGGNKRIT